MWAAKDGHRPINRARRHFLGMAAAAGARVAVISAAAVTATAAPAHALGKAWWKGGGGGNHGGGGASGGGGGGGGGTSAGGGNSGGSPGTSVSCFLLGTSIKTATGEVAVENLRIGDLVETVRGEALPIRWIGHQTFQKSGPAWDESVMPIRVARHALGPLTPHTDLYLSAGHALYINGTLIRAKDLVNGLTIVPALPDDRETLEYFHIVLDDHQVVLAEGAPAETFLYWVHNRESMANVSEYERLYPAAARRSMKAYAPIALNESGRQHLKALLLLAVSPFAPVEDPYLDAYDRIVARAEELTSA